MMTDSFSDRLDRAARAASVEARRPVFRIGDKVDSFPLIEDAFRIAGADVAFEATVESGSNCAEWYVVRTAPKLEDKVEGGIQEHGFATYAPKLKVWREVKRPKPGKPRKRAVTLPLFVGYLFVGFPQGAGRHFGTVRGVTHVHSFIAVQGSPLRVPTQAIEGLRADEDAGFYDETKDKPPKYRPGQPVRVASGPFAGMTGHVSQLRTGERIRVLLNLLGSISAVTVPIDHVEART